MTALITRRLRVIGVALKKAFQGGADVVAGPRSRLVEEFRGASIRERRATQATLDQRVQVR